MVAMPPAKSTRISRENLQRAWHKLRTSGNIYKGDISTVILPRVNIQIISTFVTWHGGVEYNDLRDPSTLPQRRAVYCYYEYWRENFLHVRQTLVIYGGCRWAICACIADRKCVFVPFSRHTDSPCLVLPRLVSWVVLQSTFIINNTCQVYKK
jgi:hypothetical protein